MRRDIMLVQHVVLVCRRVHQQFLHFQLEVRLRFRGHRDPPKQEEEEEEQAAHLARKATGNNTEPKCTQSTITQGTHIYMRTLARTHNL